MSVRSLNKVMLIGNLTRDPELRYTPSGTAVCSFGVATNRSWTTESGDKKEETEFHRVLAWNKLAELCSQLLSKGRKVYVDGRLQTRQWQTADGQPRQTTEIVIDDMIVLDSRRMGTTSGREVSTDVASAAAVTNNAAEDAGSQAGTPKPTAKSDQKKPAAKTDQDTPEVKEQVSPEADVIPEGSESEEINPDDIPF